MCGLDVPEPYWPSWSVTGVALPFTLMNSTEEDLLVSDVTFEAAQTTQNGKITNEQELKITWKEEAVT
jgi:hypothetical protein